MRVIINSVTYERVRNLTFAPGTDITGDTVPVNEFSVDIATDDTIGVNQYAYLYDNGTTLYAKYLIIYSERVDYEYVHIRAVSGIYFLEGKYATAGMYSGASAAHVLQYEVFDSIGGSSAFVLDSSLASATLTGFCPKQSKRERLQWICFVLGAYVKTYFTDKIEILPLNSSSVLMIPLKDTYWRPSVTYTDYVTKITVTGFTFTNTGGDDPGTKEEWVTDGLDTWTYVRTNYELANSSAPSSAPDNEIVIDDCMLITSANATQVLAYLGALYFNRRAIDLAAIDDAGAYIPGDHVNVFTDETAIDKGFIESAAYTFGSEHVKADLHIVVVEPVAAARLIIIYQYSGDEVGRASYTWPVGMSYAIDNPCVDKLSNGQRYVYTPQNEQATGTMLSGGVTDYEPMDWALHWYAESNKFYCAIYRVDECDLDDGVLEIT